MGKTIDNIVNLIKEVKDYAMPRENFGIEGYQSFTNESREVDTSRIGNKITYNKNMAEFDKVYSGDLIQNLDLKKDTVLYRINRVVELKKDAMKYLTKLDNIVEESDIELLNLKPQIMDSKRNLVILREQYSKTKDLRDISQEYKLTNWDKTKNIFYSVFSSGKIKKDTETESEMEVRVEYENEVNMLKNEIKYNKRILKDNNKNNNKFTKRKNIANREISKVMEFNSRVDGMKSFYEKYLYV